MNFGLLFTILLPFALILLAIPLAIRGWMGRRVGSHPVCGKCGYNLTGKPPDSSRCPECGLDLSAEHAVCTGDRRRRLVPLLLAFLMIAGGGILFAMFGPEAWASLDVPRPTWWLLLCARGYGPDDELIGRYQAGELSPGETASLVGAILKVDDGEISWTWYDIVKNARIAGNVSDEEWDAFWLKHTSREIWAPAEVPRRGPVPIRFSMDDLIAYDSRIGSSFHGQPHWVVSYSNVEINGVVWTPSFGVPLRPIILDLPPEILAQLRPGPQVISAVVDAYIEGNPDCHIRGATVSAKFELLP